MMAARVAGVPMPKSLMASFACSSVMFFPQVSIAASRVASVYSGLGRVFFCAIPCPMTGTVSPSANSAVPPSRSGSSFSLSSFLANTPRQPGLTMEEERERNAIPSQAHSMTKSSFSQGGENASSILPAIRV